MCAWLPGQLILTCEILVRGVEDGEWQKSSNGVGLRNK